MERDINVGDIVLMEYAKGITEYVRVNKVEDGWVFGEADDGEPYCSLIEACDKVPC